MPNQPFSFAGWGQFGYFDDGENTLSLAPLSKFPCRCSAKKIGAFVEQMYLCRRSFGVMLVNASVRVDLNHLHAVTLIGLI
jgi:hypothetical protein